MSLPLSEGSQMSNERLRLAFASVSKNLLDLGAVPIERLAEQPKSDIEGFDLPFLVPNLDLYQATNANFNTSSSSSNNNNSASLSNSHNISTPSKTDPSNLTMQYVAQLHQVCQQTFGNSEVLKFEFLEENGPNSKQCILTITRPNGLTRSYTTKPEFSRKSDAKAYVATLAVEMGAVDFILYGNKNTNAKGKQLILAPIDTKPSKKDDEKDTVEAVPPEVLDEFSKQVVDICIEWRAGRVKPQWTHYSDWKSTGNIGCALCVSLSSHSQRVYSTDLLYDSKAEAQKECSKEAIEQGVLDFIKFGNGQTAPSPADIKVDDSQQQQQLVQTPKSEAQKAVSLQAFFDSLPKPFPEVLADKPATELNPAGWLNTTLQIARGAKLSTQFHYFNDGGGKKSLHGCVLRLVGPKEVKSYFVSANFAKRNDAKAAVCFQAMSQGIGQYIRDIAKLIEDKVTQEMRGKVNQKYLPLLTSELARLKQGTQPNFEYEQDRGAFGCTLVVSLSSEPKEEEVRRWIVPTEYRTKNDAKTAVVYLAFQNGALEFVRFKGQTPPADYDPEKPYRRSGNEGQNSDMKAKIKVKQEKDLSELSNDTSAAIQEVNAESIHNKPKAGNELKKQNGNNRRDQDRDRHKGKRRQGNNSTLLPVPGLSPFSRHGPPPGPSKLSDPNISQVSAAATAVIERLTRSVDDKQHHHSQRPVAGPSVTPSWQPPPLMSRPPPHPSHPLPPHAQNWQRHQPPAPMLIPAPVTSPTYAGGVQYSVAVPLPPGAYPVHPVQHLLPPHPHPQPSSYSIFTHPLPPPPQSQPAATRSYPSPAVLTTQDGGIDSKPANSPSKTTDLHHDEIKIIAPLKVENEASREQAKRLRAPEDESQSTAPSTKRIRHTDASTAEVEKPMSTVATTQSKNSSEDTPQSHMKALLDFCAHENRPIPTCGYSTVQMEGKVMYKVWIIMAKERLELPRTFASIQTGKEHLAKRVLQRLQTQTEK